MTSNEGFKGFVTFTGLVVLIGLTAATVLYANKAQNNSSEASTKDIEPRGIEISTSATGNVKITWSTPINTLGTLFYSKDQNSKCLTIEASTYDCDFVAESVDKTKHEIELKNLASNTKYFYKIRINDGMYPANGILMSFVVPEISTTPKSEDQPNTEALSEDIAPDSTTSTLETATSEQPQTLQPTTSTAQENSDGFSIKTTPSVTAKPTAKSTPTPAPTAKPTSNNSDFEGFN